MNRALIDESVAWEIKQGNLTPPYRAQLTVNGAPVDLSTALSVNFVMRQAAGRKVIDQPAVIEDDDDPKPSWVHYLWQPGDTDTPDLYRQEWRILWPGGIPQTVPNEDYDSIRVVPVLA